MAAILIMLLVTDKRMDKRVHQQTEAENLYLAKVKNELACK